jgi:hypothetical protein
MLASSAPALPSRHLEIKQASRRRRRHAAAGGGNRNSCARNLTSLCQRVRVHYYAKRMRTCAHVRHDKTQRPRLVMDRVPA